MSGHRKVTDDRENVDYGQQVFPHTLWGKDNQVTVMFALLFYRADGKPYGHSVYYICFHSGVGQLQSEITFNPVQKNNAWVAKVP